MNSTANTAPAALDFCGWDAALILADDYGWNADWIMIESGLVSDDARYTDADIVALDVKLHALVGDPS